MIDAIAPLPIAIPLLAATALAATDMVARRWVADLVAVATAAASAALCAILLARSADGLRVYWMGGWHPRGGRLALGINLAIDPLGAGMALLAALLVLAALVYSIRYFEAVGNLFHALMLVFGAAMIGFCLTGDLFNLFVFFELMSTAAYALTGYKIEERGPLQGAINFAISNSIAAFAILTGIALIYARTGALNLAQIGQVLAGHHADGLVLVALALIVAGFLTKAAAVPFHFWLADAHAVAPTPVCVLFSGVMVELGLYAVARVYWIAFSPALGGEEPTLRAILLALGVLTAVVGATMCVTQRHLKRLLAFSTVSHVGLFIMGFALLSGPALAGLAVYVAAHGLTKAALFMGAGVLLNRYATIDEHELQGRGREVWPIGVVFAVGGLMLAAMPMVGTFFGKAMIEDAGSKLGYGWIAAVFALASALTGGAVLRVTGRIFFGWGHPEPPDEAALEAEEEEPEAAQPRGHTPAITVIPAMVLMAFAVVLGLIPGLVHGAETAAARFVDRPAYAAAVLHGAREALGPVAHHGLKPLDFGLAAISTLGAFAVAWAGLASERLEAALPSGPLRRADRALRGLRELHSGKIGDYIAWLTVGLAGLGGTFLLALR